MNVKSKMRLLTNMLAAIWFVSILQSCIKKDDFDFDKIAETHWNPNVSLPLIHSSLTINNILHLADTGSTVIDSTHFVTIIYKGNIYSMNGYEFLRFSNHQGDVKSINLTDLEIDSLTNTGSVTANRNTIFPFGSPVNGVHISSMLLSHGFLNINVESQIRHGGTLTVSMPTATLNGVFFSKDIPFTFSNQLPVIASRSFDLTGYDFTMNSMTDTFNLLPINYSVLFNFSGDTTYTTETFSIASDFNNLVMKRMIGDFGSGRIPVANEDSSRLELFNNTITGNLYFQDPKIKFLVSNSFGIPMYAYFSSLYSNSAVSGYRDIINPGTTIRIPVSSPTILGETKDTSFWIDQTNSLIQPALGTNPQYIGYSVVDSIIGGSSDNFVEDSSRFKVDVRVELQLYGSVSGLIIQDTIDFKLDRVKQIEWAKFRINITNGFPLDANTQIYFADSVYTRLDSLISPAEQIVDAGLIDLNTGIVNHPTLKTTDEYFTKARLQNIFNAKKLIIRSVLNSYNTPNSQVKIYSDYILDVRLGLQAQLKIDVQ